MDRDSRPGIIARILAWILSLFGQERGSETAHEHRHQPDTSSVDPETVRAQVQVIRDAFGTDVRVACEVPGDDSRVVFLYRAGHILVPTDRVPEVEQFLRGRSDKYAGFAEAHREPSDGMTLFTLPDSGGDGPDPELQTLDEINAALGGQVATPDHVLYVTYSTGGLCPANEPDEPNRDLPWPRETRDADRGAGVMINVVDTGWWKPAALDPEAPWLAYGVDGDAEQINPAAIHPYGGHGTFVAGVIRCQAPQAQIFVDGMLTKGGAIFESELMRQLDIAVLSNDAPNIVSISGGTHTYGDQPLRSFEHLARKHNLISNPQAPLIVAAAGNDRIDAPFWPAAFDWVVGVGSLDRDDSVSNYSNYGDWVDIYALGRDHVNAFPTGTYTCYEPPNVGQVRQFKNLAKWSGTSFSTPLITGMIAGLMTEHGLTAHEAWMRLKADGIVRQDPRIGKILTVDTPGD